jgi:hypothetical protein
MIGISYNQIAMDLPMAGLIWLLFLNVALSPLSIAVRQAKAKRPAAPN